MEIQKLEGQFGSPRRMRSLTDTVLDTMDYAFVRLEKENPGTKTDYAWESTLLPVF